MSNIKRVYIEADIPIFYNSRDVNNEQLAYTELQRIVGSLVLISYQSLKVSCVPSSRNRSFLRLLILGEEAVSGKWVEHVLETVLRAGGSPIRFAYRDIENPGEPEVVLVG